MRTFHGWVSYWDWQSQKWQPLPAPGAPVDANSGHPRVKRLVFYIWFWYFLVSYWLNLRINFYRTRIILAGYHFNYKLLKELKSQLEKDRIRWVNRSAILKSLEKIERFDRDVRASPGIQGLLKMRLPWNYHRNPLTIEFFKPNKPSLSGKCWSCEGTKSDCAIFGTLIKRSKDEKCFKISTKNYFLMGSKSIKACDEASGITCSKDFIPPVSDWIKYDVIVTLSVVWETIWRIFKIISSRKSWQAWNDII